jgi:hypothetical protein
VDIRENALQAWHVSTRWLQTAVGRLLAASASLIALAVLLWPKKDWHLEPEKLFAFIVAATTWVISNFPEQRASAHDLQLFEEFQQIITPSWTTWLRRHDFGASFSRGRFDPLWRIDHEWEGAAYTFDDPVLRPQFQALLDQIVSFAHLLARTTWVVPGTDLSTATPHGEESLEEPHVLARVQALDEASTSLANALDGFLPLARRRLNAVQSLANKVQPGGAQPG